MSTHEKIRSRGEFVCIYCGQCCSTVHILVSHESDCPKRRAKEREWDLERRRHTGHLAGVNRWDKENRGD